MYKFLKFIFGVELCMFQTVPLPVHQQESNTEFHPDPFSKQSV